jgi:hypothetical protein
MLSIVLISLLTRHVARPLADFLSATFTMNRYYCGGDVPKFEPKVRLNVRNIDKIIQKLRQLYQEKPNLFEIPTFAQKVY